MMIELKTLSPNLKWFPTINYNYITDDMWKYIKHISYLMKSYKLYDENIIYIMDKIFNYDIQQTKDNCGGYCDFHNNLICISDKLNNMNIVKHVLSHEIGHIIQAETEIFEKENKLLSEYYNHELQAESLGSVIFDVLFPNDKKDNNEFMSYFKYDSLNFLNNWFDGYIQNDLEKIFIKNYK